MRCYRTALRVAAFVVVIAALAGGADAKPKRQQVRIESDPVAATVYLGDKDSGAAGTTPLDLELPPGEHVLILELDGHLPAFETIVVEARTGKAARTPQVFTFTLSPATATLVVDAAEDEPLPDGARISVDGEDYGEAPIQVEVGVGAHLVLVRAPGRRPYEEWVEVQGGQVKLVEIGGDRLEAEVVVEEVAPAKEPGKKAAAGPLGTVRAGVEVGWRRYRYEAPRTPNLRPYDANGTALFAVEAELHPWRRLAPNRVLDRLAVVAGAGLAPTITASDDMGATVDAFWRQQHAALRYRAELVRALAIDVEAGWMHLLYTFRDTATGGLVDEVPDVDYHMIRIGARVVGRGGPVEAWLGVDNRLVVSAGLLEERFRSADVDGVGARAGAALRLLGAHLEARVEGAITRFGWQFEAESGDAYDADAGTDTLFGVTISVGGTY